MVHRAVSTEHLRTVCWVGSAGSKLRVCCSRGAVLASTRGFMACHSSYYSCWIPVGFKTPRYNDPAYPEQITDLSNPGHAHLLCLVAFFHKPFRFQPHVKGALYHAPVFRLVFGRWAGPCAPASKEVFIDQMTKVRRVFCRPYGSLQVLPLVIVRWQHFFLPLLRS